MAKRTPRLDGREHDAYVPESLGAQCGACPLRKDRSGGPVGPELHAGSLFTVVGEAPGMKEVQHGRPFVGPSGAELGAAMEAAGLRRPHASYVNVIACQPPKNDLKAYLTKVRRKGQPSPIDCCAPRLHAEIGDAIRLVPVGDVAAKAILHTTKGILAVRGGPVTREILNCQVQVLPTMHPALVLRQQRWRPVFQADIGRAVRWFQGNLQWEPYYELIKPTLAELEEFLALPASYWTYDVETDSKEPLTAALRCFGIAARVDGVDTVMVIPLLSVDGRTRFYTSGEEAYVRSRLAEVLVDGRQWVGHNAGW